MYLSKLFNIPTSNKRTRYWSNKEIEDEIIKISNMYFNGKYFPNRKDILLIMKNDSLNHAIVHRGGYKYWADKLNLKLQNNNSIIQNLGREYVKKFLSDININSIKNRGFFTINEKIRIFVSCTVVDISSDKQKYKFHIRSKEDTDINVLCGFNDNEEIIKVFILPHNKMSKTTKIEIRENSRYSIYENKWDLIFDLIENKNKK